jgi:hypothetical protein
MKTVYVIPVIYFLISLSTPSLQAENLTANEIMRKSNLFSYYAGHDQVSNVRLKILEPNEKVRKRAFTLFKVNNPKDEQFKIYIYFDDPPEMTRTAYLVWRHPNGKDDRWLYFPKSNSVTHIDDKNKRNRFVDSHFVYEDVAGRMTDKDKCEFMDNNVFDHYWIKCMAPASEKSDFKYYLAWVRKDDFIPVKFEYYDKHDQLVRLLEVLEIETIDGYPTARKIDVKEVKYGGESVIEFANIRYNVGLNDSLLSKENLTNPALKEMLYTSMPNIK